jgi:hypothetical protein
MPVHGVFSHNLSLVETRRLSVRENILTLRN